MYDKDKRTTIMNEWVGILIILALRDNVDIGIIQNYWVGVTMNNGFQSIINN